MNDWDRIACAPWPRLVALGITGDNHDLLRPGPQIQEYRDKLRRMERANKLLKAAGEMTPDGFRQAILDALKISEGEEL